MHHTQRVFETGMGRSWVNKVGDPQLMNVMESLEWDGINQLFFKFIERDESMNRVINFLISVQKIFYHKRASEIPLSSRAQYTALAPQSRVLWL